MAQRGLAPISSFEIGACPLWAQSPVGRQSGSRETFMSAQTVLELRDIVKSFPGVRALDGAKFDLRAGECHALVGENGAGKSTLMNVIAGVYRPEAGRILLGGREVVFPNPHSAARQGIGVVFQELSLVPNLSVAENIFAHRQPTRWLNLIDWPALHRQTAEMLAMFHLAVDPAALVKHLSVAQRQVVEILKALSHRPRVVILDEPTSSLTAVETKLLFENVRRLKLQGVAFIYISHHLKEVFEVADRVTVMRDGRDVDTLDTRDTTEDAIVRKMVGRELLNVYGQRTGSVGEVYFRVEGAGRKGVFQDISFDLRRGEILGLAGLVGSGRTQLGRAICGIEPLDGGRMTLDDERLKITTVRQAISRGMGYLTEDRKDQGLFARMPIRDNCVAPNLRQFAVRWGDERRADSPVCPGGSRQVQHRRAVHLATGGATFGGQPAKSAAVHVDGHPPPAADRGRAHARRRRGRPQ